MKRYKVTNRDVGVVTLNDIDRTTIRRGETREVVGDNIDFLGLHVEEIKTKTKEVKEDGN
jgi:hypothetical protein